MYRIFFILMLFIATKVNAQMQAAQKLHWDVDTTASFSVKSLPVWDLIKETGKWNEISNGYVQSVTVTGDHPTQIRTVKFADGKERKDQVAQYQPEYKMIVLKLADPLPAGIKEGIMAFYVTNKEEGGSELRITIVVKGDDAPKAALVAELRKEAAAYLRGISARLSGK